MDFSLGRSQLRATRSDSPPPDWRRAQAGGRLCAGTTRKRPPEGGRLTGDTIPSGVRDLFYGRPMTSQASGRVIAYVDGFNLYYGLKSKAWRRYYWLDLGQLVTALLRPYQQLQGVKYCTARVSAPSGSVRRQTLYIEALSATGVAVIEGKFQPRDGHCRRCGHTWPDFEEKQTDVNLAVEMMRDAHLDLFDTALLISGDSDLTPAVSAVQQLHPAKTVVVASPPGRRSDVLNSAAAAAFSIGRAKLANAQLPPVVTSATGHPLRRPVEWR